MINVLQIIDSLNAGGAERVAVNYANGLTGIVNSSHICVTREEGPLLKNIVPNVGYLYLNKKFTLDIKAIFKLRNYIISNNINIIQTHSSSFFIATIIKILSPKVKIIWHDHYGNSEFLSKRPKAILGLCSKCFSYIFSVNKELKRWSKQNLNCENVSYIKNFPVLINTISSTTKLKGNDGKRVLCLANLREQKNHSLLLEAFAVVIESFPDWSLHCVGKDFNDDYSKAFFYQIDILNLKSNVYFYDTKSDILSIMNQSDVGVLVSKSEGLPLALLEYGMAKLPVLTTDVGYCGELVSDEMLGILIKSNDKQALINSINRFILNEDYRIACAINFNLKIAQQYSANKVLKDVVNKYRELLDLINKD